MHAQRSRCFRRRPRHQAFSLIEVVIACTLLAIFALATIGGLQFSSRIARLNTHSIVAKNIAQSYVEEMMSIPFAQVGPTKYHTHDYDDNPPVWIDQPMGIRARVEFTLSGFGVLTNASTNNLTDNNIQWNAHEWDGQTVFVFDDNGYGEVARIDFNTPNTLHLDGSLAYNPGKGTKYMINGGKTVEVTVRWVYQGHDYHQSMKSLIANTRNSKDLGF